MISFNELDVRDLIRGASILGTGGGGDPERGLKLLLSDLRGGKNISLRELDGMSPDDLIVTPYFAGTIGSPEDEGDSKHFEFPTKYMLSAVETLESRVGSKVGGMIPTEIGGGNTAVTLHIAAELGIPVGDADHVGRSVPELIHSAFFLEGIQLTPSSIASPQGDLVLIEKYSDISRYEDIVRNIAVASGGKVFVVDTPVPSKVARDVAIKNSISRALELGRSVRKAVDSSEDPAAAAASFLNGKVILRGAVKDYDLVDKGGFLVGEYMLTGTREYEGKELKIWVKNENIIAWWENGKPAVIPPDLICLVDPKGWGVVNSSLKRGMEVSVVAAPADERWRTEKGLEILGPRHFRFDLDYVPVEELW